VFVDTSAIISLLDRDQPRHADAAATFRELLGSTTLVTHNYVVVESVALAQSRLGPTATRDLLDGIVPALDLVWIDADLHGASVSALLAALRRRVSLVDWVSFEVMRRRSIRTAFAFDRDFVDAGFAVTP
jgi:predicted nucleic acid-binding protein